MFLSVHELFITESKPLDRFQSFKADINDSFGRLDSENMFTEIVCPADRVRLCVSLSCSSICSTSAGLSEICC